MILGFVGSIVLLYGSVENCLFDDSFEDLRDTQKRESVILLEACICKHLGCMCYMFDLG